MTLDRRHEIYKTSNAVLLKDHQYDGCSLTSYAFKEILREPRRMMSEGVIVRISNFIPLLCKSAKHIKQITIFFTKSNKATLYACKEILGESTRDWSQAIKFPTLASVCRSKTRTSVKDVIPDTSMVNWGTSGDVDFLWPSVRSKRSYADKYYLTTHCQNPMWRHQRWNTWRVWQSWNLYGKTLY